MSEDQKALKILSKKLKLTAKQKTDVLLMRASGEMLADIASFVGIQVGSFHAYLLSDPEFNKKFEVASSKGYDTLAEKLVNIDESSSDVARARLKSDNIKWILSKRKPKVYGDKIELNVTKNLDLTQALHEAKSRVVNAPPEIEYNESEDIKLRSSIKKKTKVDIPE